MNITVVGAGYVGLSLAVLLAQRHQVTILDTDSKKVAAIQAKHSPIQDDDLALYLKEKSLQLTATLDSVAAYQGTDWVIIATPTDYDPVTHSFDTSSVESVIQQIIATNPAANIVIRSTVPVGFSESLVSDMIVLNQTSLTHLLVSPEFLRQGQALHDNLHPSRIVVGGPTDLAQAFAKLLAEVALDEVPVLLTGRREAEAIKLFSNTYLAMRVAYFNELDSFAATHQLNTRQIIDGVSLDPRIGQYYNNPSFGYGGYCLPKDTKQLLANYAVVPQNLIQAVVQSNSTRHDFVAGEILRRSPKTVGIYLLGMKAGSNSFKDSSVQEVIHRLQAKGVAVLVYEPAIQKASYQGLTVLSDWDAFVQRSDVIVANRITAQLQPVMAKVYTRDIFGGDA